MTKDIMTLLARLGLKDRECHIYLTCLKNKEGLFIFEISRYTKITRSTVDVTVRRLVQRGFLSKVKVGRRNRYSAQSPETLLFQQKQLADDFELLVPLLRKMGGQKKDMEILYFEGVQGFKQVHEDILLQTRFASGVKKDIYSFSSGTDFIRLYPNVKNFVRKRVQNGSWYRGITHHQAAKIPEWSNDQKSLRAVKYVKDESYRFSMDMQIYADSVMLYSPVEPVGGAIIRNERMADSMRALFNVMWKLL